jgi:polysaccharide pyruvyl transferase WcaK-like protein
MSTSHFQIAPAPALVERALNRLLTRVSMASSVKSFVKNFLEILIAFLRMIQSLDTVINRDTELMKTFSRNMLTVTVMSYWNEAAVEMVEVDW